MYQSYHSTILPAEPPTMLRMRWRRTSGSDAATISHGDARRTARLGVDAASSKLSEVGAAVDRIALDFPDTIQPT